MNIRKFIIKKILSIVSRRSKKNKRIRSIREVNKIIIYYRICDHGYPKEKPNYITKENCLRNAVNEFPPTKVEWHIIGDNICDTTYNMILQYLPESAIHRVSVGHGAGTFRMAYEAAIKNKDNDLIYFLEDDYLHVPGSLECLKSIAYENFEDYITLYDSPDKYGYKNINPFVIHGAEVTKLYLTDNHHWKVTNSTTMTMAAFVDVLKRDKATWWRWTETKHPYDFQIFNDLRIFSKANIICPVPSLSTHGETAFLAKLIDWEKTTPQDVK